MAKQEKSAAELYREERKARIAKAAKKNAKKSHSVTISKTGSRVIAVVVVLAIALGCVAVALNTTGVLERGKTVMTVGETEIDKYEYGFYYTSTFNNYFNMSYQYDTYYGEGYGVMFTGYDYLTSPDEQSYSGEIEGVEDPTFADFFDYSAKQQLQYVEGARLYAAENDITLTEEEIAEVDAQIEEYRTEAADGDRKYSLPAYLRESFGKGMTEELFREILLDQALVTKVSEVKTQELKDSYSDKKIEEVYKEEITTYGVVTLRNYVVAAETVTVESEDESEDATTEVTDETMAAAKTKAEAFAAAATDDEKFKSLAADYEKAAGNDDYEEMISDDSVTLIEDAAYSDISSTDADFLAWAFDEETAKGETYIVEEDGTGYTVYLMVAPVHKTADEKTYDVRHILLQFPEDEEEETTDEETTDEATTDEAEGTEEETVKAELLDTSAYDAVVDIDVDLEETADPALYMETQEILKKYLEGEMTEEAFAALAVEYSADSNAEDGGIYEEVTEGYMVAPFENWALEEGRKYGDVGIVETSYGYHIMYFIGTATTTWSDVIRSDLATEDYNTFSEELVEQDNVSITITDEANAADMAEQVLVKARTYARNIQQSSYY